MSDRQYKDASGNPRTLLWLVRNEPEWAENQIKQRDKLERELADAKARIERLEKAGDAMANWIGVDSWHAESWRAAKETKP